MLAKKNSLQLKIPLEEQCPATWKCLNQGTIDTVAPGFVAGVWRKKDPNSALVFPVGKRRLYPSSQLLTAETYFDLASVTKVFSTASVCAALVDRGWISWDDSVKSIISEFRFSDIQLKHLLSHTAGYHAWSPFWEEIKANFSHVSLHKVSIQKRKEMMKKLILAVNPEVKPGEKVLYSDISFILLGFVIESLTQMPLENAVNQFVWKPMGLNHSFYSKTNKDCKSGVITKVAATEDCPWRGGVLQGQVHDDNCWSMGGVAGHAGAFSNIHDVLLFSKNLLNGFLSLNTLREFWKKVEKPINCERTLGWDTPSLGNTCLGDCFSDQSVGHLGFTGTSLWIDPTQGLAVSLLSNRVHPTRENDKIKSFRKRFHNAVCDDFIK